MSVLKNSAKRRASAIEDAAHKKSAIVLPSFLIGGNEDAVLERGVTKKEATSYHRETPEEESLFTVPKAKKQATRTKNVTKKDDAEVPFVVKHKKTEDDVVQDTIDKITTAHVLTLSQLSVGTVIAGVVKSISELEIAVALPDGMYGFVSLREVSDTMADLVDDYIIKSENQEETDDLPSLSTMFTVGQLVRCVVIKFVQKDESKTKNSKPQIELSLRPSLINGPIDTAYLTKNFPLVGAIKSVEEKGYTIDLGLTNTAGFLANTNTENTFVRGQIIECSLLADFSGQRVIQVTATSNVVSQAVVTPSASVIPISVIKPFHLVNCTVVNHLPEGIVLRFLNYFYGTASLIHIDHQMDFDQKSIEKKYPIGKKVKARVLFVNPDTKTVSLTLRPEIVQNFRGTSFPSSLMSGIVIEDATVMKILSNNTVLFNLSNYFSQDDSSEESTYPIGVMSLRDMSDKAIDALPSSVKVGEQFKVRVVNTNVMQGVVRLTMKPSAMAYSIATYHDLQGGQLVKGKVVHISENTGVFFSIALEDSKENGFNPHVQGLVHISHLRDVSTSKTVGSLSKKFKEGSIHTLRVILCDPEEKKLLLTAKKNLVESQHPIISSFESGTALLKEQPYFTVDAYVGAVTEAGLFVNFYGKTAGFITLDDLHKSGNLDSSEKISAVFIRGQSIKVRVVGFDVRRKQFFVSSDLNSTDAVKDKKSNSLFIVFGTIVEGTVVGARNEDTLEISCINPETNAPFTCYLSDHHLCDSVQNSKALFAYHLANKTHFKHLMVSYFEKGDFYVSAKPLLLAQAAGPRFSFDFVTKLESTKSFFTTFEDALQSAGLRAGKLTESIPTTMSSSLFTVGAKLTGFITHHSAHGAFVRFAGRASTLAHLSLLEGNISTLETNYPIGQTVQGFVNEVTVAEDNTKKISFALDTAKANTPNNTSSKKTLRFSTVAFYAERSLCIANNISMDGSKFTATPLKLGQVVDGKVSKTTNDEVIVKFTSTKTMARLTPDSTKYKVGDSVCVSIIDIECDSNMMDAVATKNTDKSSNTSDKISKLKVLESTKALLLAISGQKAIVSLVNQGNYIATAMLENNNSSIFTVGQVYDVTVAHIPKSIESTNQNALEVYKRVLVTLPFQNIKLDVFQDKVKHEKTKYSSTEKPELGAIFSNVTVVSVLKNNKADIGLHIQLPGYSIPTVVYNVEISDEHRPRATKNYFVGCTIPEVVVVGYDSNNICLCSMRTSRIMDVRQGKLNLKNPSTKFYYNFSLSKTHAAKTETQSELEQRSEAAAQDSSVRVQKLQNLNDEEKMKKFAGMFHYEFEDKIVSDNGDEVDIIKTYNSILRYEDLAPGMLVQGYVERVSKDARPSLIVRLSAFVVVDASLAFAATKSTKHYPNGALITVRIREIFGSTEGLKRVNREYSYYKHHPYYVIASPQEAHTSVTNANVIKSLYPTMIVKCVVEKVIAGKGILLLLKDTDIAAFASLRDCSDDFSADVQSYYKPGDKVKAVVLRVGKSRLRVTVGLKGSLFIAAAYMNDKKIWGPSKNDDMDDNDDIVKVEQVDSDDEMNDDVTDIVISTTPTALDSSKHVTTIDTVSSQAPSLFSSIMFGSTQTTTVDDEEEEELLALSDDEGDSSSAKKAKSEQQKRDEVAARLAERAIMEDAKAETSDEHERNCLRTPRNSYVWIQYMGHELSQGNVTKARSIFTRALSAIPASDSVERWNLWVSIITLENVFGTYENLLKTVDEASKYNDPRKVYMELGRILTVSQKFDRAHEAYTTAVKRHFSSEHGLDMFTIWINMLFKCGKLDQAREVLQTAISKLPSRDHVAITIQVAKLEFQDPAGSPERGRVMFEKLLANYPKRLDIWFVFIDQESKLIRVLSRNVSGSLKAGDIKKAKSRVRTILDNITGENYWKTWSPRQMKLLFKKYIEFETEFGNDAKVSGVQDKATIYVATLSAQE